MKKGSTVSTEIRAKISATKLRGRTLPAETVLYELYITKNLSIRKIAAMLGCCSFTISSRLKGFGIHKESVVFNQQKIHLGDSNSRWRGGRRKRRDYVAVKAPGHPYADGQNYVLEHRLVVEKVIGRYLRPFEKVHHKNGIKDDNRPENLQVVTPLEHLSVEEYCKGCEMKQEIRLLRFQIKELMAKIEVAHAKS